MSRSLRVLYLTKTAVGATWAVRQTRDHVELGIDAHLAAPAEGPRLAEYRAAGVTVHAVETDFPVRQPWLVPGRLKQLRALVAELEPDLVHTYFVGNTVTARLALGRKHPIPRVFQVPGPLHLENAFFRRAEIMLAGSSDYWIGTCQSINDAYLAAGVEPERLFVSDYGVDADDFVHHPEGKLRAELGLADDVPLVGMVGIIYAPKRHLLQRRGLKGHEDFIDALAVVLRRRPEVRGVIIGGAWQRSAAFEAHLHAYAREKCGDSISFLGMRKDVPELLPDFDIAVQPSHSDGVAATAVEAQLLGIPVIASAVGGQLDLIVDGETGWLVPAKDPASLAVAMLEALDDPARTRTIAENGRRRAQRLFDGKKNNAEVLGMYDQVLRHAGATPAR